MVGKRGPNAAGLRVRENLIQSALKLFAKRGYAGVSTREIAALAEVNQAAIYYHFGTKEQLYIEAVIYCFNVVARSRIKALEKIEFGKNAKVEDVLGAFILPHLDYARTADGQNYLRIFATFATTPSEILDKLYKDHFGPHRTEFIEALKRAEPSYDRARINRAFSIVADLLVASLFDHGIESTRGNTDQALSNEQLAEMLINYNAAGLRTLMVK